MRVPMHSSTHKRCFRCGCLKTLADFYAHPMMVSGRLNKCKACCMADARANYRAKHERYLAYEHLPARREARRERSLETTRAQRAKYPDKYAARTAVSNAVRDGRLIKRACNVCGSPDVEGHHTDYSKPLDVMWLCRYHHQQIEGRLIA
jgi:hypothetical protein